MEVRAEVGLLSHSVRIAGGLSQASFGGAVVVTGPNASLALSHVEVAGNGRLSPAVAAVQVTGETHVEQARAVPRVMSVTDVLVWHM